MKKSAPKAKATATATATAAAKAKASAAMESVSEYVQREDVKNKAKGAGIAFVAYCIYSTLAS